MALQSIGDLAQDFMLRRQSVSLKREMDRLTQEVSTGQAADIPRHLSGHLQPLADIERALVLNEAHGQAARLAAVDSGLMQTALEQVETATRTLAERTLAASHAPGALPPGLVANEARAALGTVIDALNGSSAGRALFGGDRVERAPLAEADTLLADLRAALGGAGDRAALDAALETFFDTPGGGFATGIYRGGTDPATGYDLGAGESVTLRITAADSALRAQIKQTAMAALLDDETLPLAGEERKALAQGLGQALLSGQDGVIGLRAALGNAESRIAQAESRTAAEKTGLGIARNDLVSVDLFESAAALEGVQVQLETLYTLTARTARLNLAAFLS